MTGKLSAFFSESDASQKMIEFFGEGATEVEFCAYIGVPVSEHEQLKDTNEPYAEVVGMCVTYSMAWWACAKRRAVSDRKINMAAILEFDPYKSDIMSVTPRLEVKII